MPFRGDPVILGAAAVLFLAAYLAVGALLVLLVRSLAAGLALVGIVCSPAFGFAGVGFPILAMGDFAKGWGALLPLRWYIQILVDQAARGVPPRLANVLSQTVRRVPVGPVAAFTPWNFPMAIPSWKMMPAIVAGIKGANPEITLQEICNRLEKMRERTPRGRTSWQPSSVKMLLERAERLGLLE